MCFKIAVSPSNPNHIAIGINTVQIYITTDGAESWRSKRRGIMSNGVQSVAFEPNNSHILWAAGAAMVAKNMDPQADGIYRSTDCGGNWELLRNAGYIAHKGQNEYFAFDKASFDGTQCRTVYAATHNDGLLKTTDAGETWKVLGFHNVIIHAVILHPVNNNLL